jgi:hypothetical protein
MISIDGCQQFVPLVMLSKAPVVLFVLLHASPQGTARNEKKGSLSRRLVSKDSSPGRSQARAVMVIVFN